MFVEINYRYENFLPGCKKLISAVNVCMGTGTEVFVTFALWLHFSAMKVAACWIHMY